MNTNFKPDFAEIADRYVRRTLPEASEKKTKEAIRNFAEYLEVIWNMQERLEQGGLDLSQDDEDAERNFLCKSCCPPLENRPISLDSQTKPNNSSIPEQGSLPFIM